MAQAARNPVVPDTPSWVREMMEWLLRGVLHCPRALFNLWHCQQDTNTLRLRNRRLLRFEQLAERVVLSGTPIVLEPGVLDNFQYVDPDGDVVVIEVTGTTGQVTLLEAIGDGFGNDDGVLENGEQLGTIRLQNASSDFKIAIRSDVSGSIGNGVVTLGKLVALDEAFRGLTAGGGIPGGALFELQSITAGALSSGGEIQVGRITGDEHGAAVILEQLAAGTNIRVSHTLTGAVAIGADWNGTIEAGGFWSGTIAVGGNLGTSGQLIAGNSVVGDVAISGNLNGTVDIALRNYGRWTVVGNVASTATLNAGQHFTRLDVVGSFHGTLTTQQSAELRVGQGIGSAAQIDARTVNLHAGGSFHGTIHSTALSYVKTDANFAPQSRVHSETSTVALYGGSIYARSAQTGPTVQRIHYPTETLTTAITIGRLPYTITRPGTYVLRTDMAVNLARGAAITIAANNVTIDLQGRSIVNTYGSRTTAVGIEGLNRSGVTVQNGTIRGFMVAIELIGQVNHHSIDVNNVRAIDNWYHGIRVAATGATVRNSHVIGTGGSQFSPAYTIPIGIRVLGQNSSVVNTVVANFRRDAHTIETVGIHVDAAPNSTIQGNVFREPVRSSLTWASWVNRGVTSTHGITHVTFDRNFFFRYDIGVQYANSDGGHRSNVLVTVGTPFVNGTDLGKNVTVD